MVERKRCRSIAIAQKLWARTCLAGSVFLQRRAVSTGFKQFLPQHSITLLARGVSVR